VHELVADLPRRHVARPADDARGPVRTLKAGEQTAPPWPREPGPQAPELVAIPLWYGVSGVGAVVGGPHDDRVINDPELVEGVEEPAGEIVHLGQTSAQFPCLVLPTYSGSGIVGLCTCVYGRYM
jgi:hypothetical protein